MSTLHHVLCRDAVTFRVTSSYIKVHQNRDENDDKKHDVRKKIGVKKSDKNPKCESSSTIWIKMNKDSVSHLTVQVRIQVHYPYVDVTSRVMQ